MSLGRRSGLRLLDDLLQTFSRKWVEELVTVPTPQDKVQQRIVEQIVEIPVCLATERIAEQIADIPVPQTGLALLHDFNS